LVAFLGLSALVAAPSRVAAQGGCRVRVPIFEGGARTRTVCAEPAEVSGLTIVDLGDDWAPFVFSEDPSMGEMGAQPYRAVYTALADERFDALPESVDPERYLELFGISPTFRVLLARLGDEPRHACHDAVDDRALGSLTRTIRPFEVDVAAARERVTRVAQLGAQLERARVREGVERVEDLATHERWGRVYERWARERVLVDAVAAAQAHLRCEGLLTGRVATGVFDWWSAMALAELQRRRLVVGPPHLDAATRAALMADSREADFLALLRTLRERVADAHTIIEDGSARHEWGTVLGRVLDPPEMRSEAGQPALANGATDHISRATEVAARALGFTDPAEAARSLRSIRAEGLTKVALRLPAPPRYHADHMELRAELDRGDVYYGYPYTSTGGVRGQRVERRPVLTLFARDGDREIALVRWPTTIGGWKPERLPGGGVALRYKGSPVGPRIWRDVVAAPAWLPPPTTPDDELVRRTPRGYVPNHDLFGPGYRSAYGLAMLMHHRVIPPRREGGETIFFDEGVRSHGSVSYRSILSGQSHGCHRLYNHLALRLTSFVLRHRAHVRRGVMPVRYVRTVHADGRALRFELDSRGYLYELTPPVPIEVLEGTVRGRVRQPIEGARPLRDQLLIRQVEAEAAADE
jgi:hypothetical protein